MKANAYILLVLGLTGCSEATAPSGTSQVVTNPTDATVTCKVDPLLVEVLPFRAGLGLGAYREDAERPIAHSDIEAAECLLIDEVSRDTSGQSHGALSQGLERYMRQYCAVTDSTAHRFIYVNAYCYEGRKPAIPMRSTRWYVVEDGGDCYFQALLDLTTGAVVFFSVNGDA